MNAALGEGIPWDRLLASADAGVAPPAVSGEKPSPGVLAGIPADARLNESYGVLADDGWQLRRSWYTESRRPFALAFVSSFEPAPHT